MVTRALNNLLSEGAGTATKEHEFRWLDQSGQGQGPLMLLSRYGTFVVSFTEAATYSNGSAVITGITNTVGIKVGMQFTATGFTGTQTVLSVGSATQITASTNATGAGGATTLTFTNQVAADPVINIGYNYDGSNELTAREGYAVLQIEGHYHRDTDNIPIMEMFFALGVTGSVGQARPIGVLYDKLNKKTLDVGLSPGTGRLLNIQFSDYTGQYGDSYQFAENDFKLLRSPRIANNTIFTMDSAAGFGSYFQMSADGESITQPSFTQNVVRVGAQNRQMSYSMRDGNGVSKIGVMCLRADSTAGVNSVLFTVGGNSSANDSLVTFDHVNIPTNYPTLKLKGKTGQTRGTFEITDGSGNEQRLKIFPTGYFVVRESGNTTTDRIPTNGVNTVTQTLTDCPGVGTTQKWFPILDSGAGLFWFLAKSNG